MKTTVFAILTLFSSAYLLISCEKDQVDIPDQTGENGSTFQKLEVEYKGVSFVSPSSPVGPESFDPIVEVNANSVSIIPFGFVYSGDSIVYYNQSFQWWGEKDEGVIDLINSAQSKGLKVMVKPQIWMLSGTFTGDFELTTQTQWTSFENTYQDYIVHYAHLADSMNCELFSIGTEFKKFVELRPQFWSNLIDTVRTEFNGALTYAENWDAFQSVPFWDQLDYIGIDAYFPLSNQMTPSKEDCINGWLPHLTLIEQIQNQENIPVIFTEFGYRSRDFCAQEPWDSSNGGAVNLDAQQNAYEALCFTFWDKPWFQGGFVWKWFPDHTNSGGGSDNRFTPQNKPAEIVLKGIYE